MPSENPVARAFELARSGTCRDIVDLRRKLRTEGYPGNAIDAHLGSATLKKQLRAAIIARRTGTILPDEPA